MKRTVLKRKTLKRGAPAASEPPAKGTKRSRRERNLDYMAIVRALPCVVEGIMAPHGFLLAAGAARRRALWRAYNHLLEMRRCDGPVKAYHMGDRGLNHAAPDETCAPMCRKHHDARTRARGMFWFASKADLREWRSAAMLHTAVEIAAMRRIVSAVATVKTSNSPAEPGRGQERTKACAEAFIAAKRAYTDGIALATSARARAQKP